MDTKTRQELAKATDLYEDIITNQFCSADPCEDGCVHDVFGGYLNLVAEIERGEPEGNPIEAAHDALLDDSHMDRPDVAIDFVRQAIAESEGAEEYATAVQYLTERGIDEGGTPYQTILIARALRAEDSEVLNGES